MTNDTTKAPHCPRCGGEMVREAELPMAVNDRAVWTAYCDGCGFPNDGKYHTHRLVRDAWEEAMRLVRAELARQALEMWTRLDADIAYDSAQRYVLKAYEWLGTHPLRLPGEEA